MGLDYDKYEVYTAPARGCLGPDMESFDRAVDTRPAGLEMSGAWKHINKNMNFKARRHAVGITNGLAERDGNEEFRFSNIKAKREQAFPLQLVRQAFDFEVQDGQASVSSDRDHILEYIKGNVRARMHEDESRPIRMRTKSISAVISTSRDSHINRGWYQKPGCNDFASVNALLHGRFAQAFWRTLLETKGPGHALMQRCASRLLSSGLTKVSLSFHDCLKCDNEALSMLVQHLPLQLQELYLDLDGECAVTSGELILEEIVVRRQKSTDYPQVKVLSLPHCKLRCEIPQQICRCSELEVLRLESNEMCGHIPEQLGQCTALKDLFLFDNELHGPIPVSIGKCANLVRFYSGHNTLVDSVPQEIGRCQRLRRIYLACNQLSGPIPKGLCELPDLERLFLDDNQLTGDIPLETGQWPRLEVLYLHCNLLAGVLPVALNSCSQLRDVSLMCNERLEVSSICPALVKCTKLEKLYLDRSQRELISAERNHVSRACEAAKNHLIKCVGTDELAQYKYEKEWKAFGWDVAFTHCRDIFTFTQLEPLDENVCTP